MVPSTRWVRVSTVARASLLALLVLLCAGGGADAAMLLVGHGDMDCGAHAPSTTHDDCRATSLELPSLALPTLVGELVAPEAAASTVTAAVTVRAPQKSSAPSVPRSPPLV